MRFLSSLVGIAVVGALATAALPLAVGAASSPSPAPSSATAVIHGSLTAKGSDGTAVASMPCATMKITAITLPARTVLATGTVSAAGAARCSYTMTVPAGVAMTVFLSSYTPRLVNLASTIALVPNTSVPVAALASGQSLTLDLAGVAEKSGRQS
jgi:hypothetical protein